MSMIILGLIANTSTSFANYGQAVTMNTCGTSGNSGGSGGSIGGGSNYIYPPYQSYTPGEDPNAPTADIHISHLRIGWSKHHLHDKLEIALQPGVSKRIHIEGRAKNDMTHGNFDMVRYQYCVTNKKKFVHNGRKWLDQDYLDDDELDDLDSGDRESKNARHTTVKLSQDMKTVTVTTNGGNSYTFTITDRDRERNEFHLYFWLDMKAEVGSSEDRDVSTSQGSRDEYGHLVLFLPDFNSAFELSSMVIDTESDINFTNKPSVVNNANISYHWDLGDGYTSTSIHPSHTYTQSGIYSVKLTTTASWGEVKTSLATVVVEEPITETPEEPELPFTDFRRADVNNDGVINSTDKDLSLEKSLMDEDEFPEGWVESSLGMVGDVNCSESVTIVDTMLISRYINNTSMSETSWCATPISEEEQPFPEPTNPAYDYLENVNWNVDGWGQANDVGIYSYDPLQMEVSNFTGGEAKFRSDWITLDAGSYDINLQTSGNFTNAELLIEEDDNGTISYHSAWLGSPGNTTLNLNLSGTRDISVVLKLKSSGTLTVNSISLMGEGAGNEGDEGNPGNSDNYANLTLATGTAIGYGGGTVEGQTESFQINDTIHFGVFAEVNVPHTWRIEMYHNNGDDPWWGQDSDSRDALAHSFHSLNQEVSTTGTFTFKVFMDIGNGFEYVGEKSIVVE